MILPLQGKQRISPLERNGCSTQGLSRLSRPWPRNPSPHQLCCMHNSTAQQRYVHKSMNCSIVLKSKNCNCWIWLGVYLQKLHPSIWKNIIYPLPWWLYKLWKSKITKWPVCVDCSSENPNLWFVTGSELETERLRADTGLCELCSTTWMRQVGCLKEWENSIHVGIVSPQITGEIKRGCKAVLHTSIGKCTHTHAHTHTHTHSCTQFPETRAVDLGTFMFFLRVCVLSCIRLSLNQAHDDKSIVK